MRFGKHMQDRGVSDLFDKALCPAFNMLQHNFAHGGPSAASHYAWSILKFEHRRGFSLHWPCPVGPDQNKECKAEAAKYCQSIQTESDNACQSAVTIVCNLGKVSTDVGVEADLTVLKRSDSRLVTTGRYDLLGRPLMVIEVSLGVVMGISGWWIAGAVLCLQGTTGGGQCLPLHGAH